jgi:hypothetical protein
MSQLEDYLLGKPLSPEIAELMHGLEETTKQPAPPTVIGNRTLSESDLKALSQLRSYPGWEVLIVLLDATIDRYRENIIHLSEFDPIGNREEITAGWLEVKTWRRTKEALSSIIDEAVAAIGRKE